MNTALRTCYRIYNYSIEEVFLNYLRRNGAFSHMTGNHGNDVNPYWWGAVYEYSVGSAVLKDLMEKKSIKKSRMNEIINYLKNDLNSPIVRLTGLHLEREFKKYC